MDRRGAELTCPDLGQTALVSFMRAEALKIEDADHLAFVGSEASGQSLRLTPTARTLSHHSPSLVVRPTGRHARAADPRSTHWARPQDWRSLERLIRISVVR